MKLLPEFFVYAYVAVKIPLRFPGNISVLEFFSIESSLKATMDQTKRETFT